MFGGSRRRRPPTAHRKSTTANPNATTAAASAYMSAANYNPNKALSSAAAAAALRARPHTPTNVAEVQTKRTIRRSASVSSTGSGPMGAGLANRHYRPDRPGSSASMTERTFRSPSPHRPSAPAPREHQPPVPQIPDSHRRSAMNSRGMGVGMQNFHTASEKMRSEQPSWYVGPVGDTSNVRRSDSILETANSPQNADPQPVRPDSRSSVNFSYPTTFRPQSSSGSLILPGGSHATVPLSQLVLASNTSRRASSHSGAQDTQELVYDPNSRRMIPKAHAEGFFEHQIKQVSKKQSRRRSSGSRHEKGQMAIATASTVKGTIVDGDKDKDLHGLHEQKQHTMEPLPTAQETHPQEQSGVETAIPAENFDDPNKSPTSSVLRESKLGNSPPVLQKPHTELYNAHRELSLSARNFMANTLDEPAMNDEQSHTESSRQPRLTVLDALDAIPTRQILFSSSRPQHRQYEQTIIGNETASPQEFRTSYSIDKPGSSGVSGEQEATVVENKPIVGLAGRSDSLGRSSSNSPARQARFAPRPAEKLSVRHVPLPRSASPMKSAMKHTSPILRGTSSPDSCSDPPDQKEDSTTSRKKPVRVSFDDHGTVIAGEPVSAPEADSSSAQSPQGGKRAWFSNLGRGKRKEYTLDEDEIMKPRPALPSFGSVREKRIREFGERPLVRPPETPRSPAIFSSPALGPHSSSTLTDSEITEAPSLGQSSDHAVGATLLQDQTARNVANISRFREPLTPTVTSVEGCEYTSESLHGSDGEEHHDSTVESRPSTIIPSIFSTPPAKSDPEVSSRDTSTAMATPQSKQETPGTPKTMATQQQDTTRISMTQPRSMTSGNASWTGEKGTSPYFDIPGGFPDYGAGITYDNKLRVVKDEVTENGLSSSAAVFKSDAAVANTNNEGSSPQTTLETATVVTDLANITDDESEESIYSDAYEDIPDFDSGGFASLNAVVQSPADEQPTASTYGTAEKLPMPVVTIDRKCDAISESNRCSQAQSAPPRDASDWEQAKAFWRSLTAEKRRQLELEAAEEAGAEGDWEDVSQSVRRISAKKQPPGHTHVTRDIPVKPKSRVQISLGDEPISQSANAPSQTGMYKTVGSNGGTQSTVNPPTRPSPNRDEVVKLRTLPSAQSTSRNQLATPVRPALQRQGSDTSDSSFKRNRLPLSSGTFAFRKTMRQASPIPPRFGSTRSSGRFSLRSLSPTGSARRHETNISSLKSPPGEMRRTLRSISQPRTEGKRSSVHFPLFSRSSKVSPKNSKWSSRFDGSSDEDEGVITRFQSRVHDSSDEEHHRPVSAREAKILAKGTLRGSKTAPSFSRPAPVPELEEHSPELPDSDDGLMPSPLRNPQSRAANGDFNSRPGMGRSSSVAIGTSTLGRSGSGRGRFASSFTSPALPATEKRGSFLGILRRNKRADHFGQMQRLEPVGSTARRDTKSEWDFRQLNDLRGEQSLSPRLQKNPSVSRKDGGGLQSPASAGNPLGRSATTGAIGSYNGDRLSLGYERNGGGYDVENTSIEGTGPLKKKKFGALRRMFKLDE